MPDLSYGKDERWKVRFADSYLAAQSVIGGSPQEGASSNRWSSLVTAEYTTRSIGLLFKGTLKPKIELAQNVDEDVGGKFPIILQDGSNVYSSEYITETQINSKFSSALHRD
jgi:hypothetical protein